MLKKVIAAVMCSVMAAVSLTSCGDDAASNSKSKKDDLKDDNSSSVSESEKDSKSESASSIANFTEPKKGEQVILMKVKDYGEIKIKLFPEYADKGVENFVELAKKGYYDGLTFHRVINDFMIQGGDPLGNGTGGESIWGEKFDGGTDSHLIHAAGAVAYANSGSTDTNGSQFYIVTGHVYDSETLSQMASYYRITFSEEAQKIYTEVGGTPWLDGSYTVFGQVYDGLDVVFQIQEAETDPSNKPLESIIMESVTVGEYDGEDIHWYISDYQ